MKTIERARSMLGAPYLHLGRDANGIDCIGLVAYALEYDEKKLPAYTSDPFNGELERNLDAILGAPGAVVQGATYEDIHIGDVVALAYIKQVRHVALVAQHPTITGVLTLIHTDSTLGMVTEHTLDAKWLRRIRRVYTP